MSCATYTATQAAKRRRIAIQKTVGEFCAGLGLLGLVFLGWAGICTPLAIVPTLSPVGLCVVAGMFASLVLLVCGLAVWMDANR